MFAGLLGIDVEDGAVVLFVDDVKDVVVGEVASLSIN